VADGSQPCDQDHERVNAPLPAKSFKSEAAPSTATLSEFPPVTFVGPAELIAGTRGTGNSPASFFPRKLAVPQSTSDSTVPVASRVIGVLDTGSGERPKRKAGFAEPEKYGGQGQVGIRDRQLHHRISIGGKSGISEITLAQFHPGSNSEQLHLLSRRAPAPPRKRFAPRLLSHVRVCRIYPQIPGQRKAV